MQVVTLQQSGFANDDLLLAGGSRRSGCFAGQLVFVSSYFDFVRLRNWLDEQEGASWGAVSEYTEAPEVARARSLFAKGRTRLLLYTERLHFYFRHHFRGVQVH